MKPLKRMIAISLAGLCLAALSACSGGGQDAETSANLCKELGDRFYRAKHAAYSMDLAEAESLYVQLLASRRTEGAAACADLPTEARILAHLSNVRSGQLQFLSARELRDRARELSRTQADAADTGLGKELETIALVDRLHRSSIEGQTPAEAPAGEGEAPAGPDESLAASRPDGGKDGETAVSGKGGRLLELEPEERQRIVSDAWSLLARSAALTLSGEAEDAIALLNQGLDSLAWVPVAARTMRPRFYVQKALAEMELGRNAEAVASAELGVEGLDAVVPNSAVSARARFVHAIALAGAGEAEAAVQEYDAALALYEQNPVAIQYESAWPLFRQALATLAAGGEDMAAWKERTFRAAQLVRSSATVTAIANAARLFATGEGEAANAVRDWKAAEARLVLMKGLWLGAQQDPLMLRPQLEALEAEVAAADAAEREARARRDRIAPYYRQALETPIELADLQERLKPGEAFVQILIGKPRSLLILVLPQRVEVRPVDGERDTIEQIVAGMRSVLEADYVSADTVAVEQFPADLSHEIYKLLFGDLASVVEAQDRLFVAANGILQSYPFDTLVTADPGSGEGTWKGAPFDYSGVRWLGDAVEVNYLPAARNLVDMRSASRPSEARNAVLAFGDFRPGITADALMRSAGLPAGCRAFAEAVAQAPRLADTGRQAEAIVRALGDGSQAVVGEAFTEGYFERNAARLHDYRILHFATHGLLPSSANCLTEPALTVSFDPDSMGDSLLSTPEIRQFNLDAQLVVLSACETVGAEGRLAETGGESLSTLARAFFYAGSRSIIASHWRVLTEETSLLMDAMYRRIATENAGFGAALRGAQQELRRRPETSHPTFWAAFVLVGDGTTQLYPDRPGTTAANLALTSEPHDG